MAVQEHAVRIGAELARMRQAVADGERAVLQEVGVVHLRVEAIVHHHHGEALRRERLAGEAVVAAARRMFHEPP